MGQGPLVPLRYLMKCWSPGRQTAYLKICFAKNIIRKSSERTRQKVRLISCNVGSLQFQTKSDDTWEKDWESTCGQHSPLMERLLQKANPGKFSTSKEGFIKGINIFEGSESNPVSCKMDERQRFQNIC